VDSPSTIALSLFSAWALLYLPGRALIRAGSTTLPTAFARIVVGVVVTTLVGTGLAAAEAFSLANLLVADAVASALLFALRRRLAPDPGGPRPARDLLGPALVAAALGVYWPAYPVFLGGSDATAYLGSAISLARHGTLAREDELGPALPPDVQTVVFDSMSQVFLEPGSPYRRVPGAMFIEEHGDARAWPCFFPVPSVWGAVSALRGGTLDERDAADFAPFFAALALWAFWQLARQWLGSTWGLVAAALLGVSGPWYTAAHMPMSELIAAFFVFSGLAFTAAAHRSAQRSVQAASTLRSVEAASAQGSVQAAGARPADAMLAGAALGAAVFTRIEVAMLLALAFALLPAFARGRDDAALRLPTIFFAMLVGIGSLVLVQTVLLPGTYVAPLVDHLKNVRVNFHLRFGYPSPVVLAAAAAAALAAFAAVVRAFGLSATIRWGIILGALAGHAAASRFLYERTPMWLSLYVGWTGLALFVAGGLLAWRSRAWLPAGTFIVALTAAVSAILFYNPHVYPSLPWGARRFVPMLLPLMVLLAAYAVSVMSARSRLAAAALAALLAWPVLEGTRTTWDEPVVGGTWDQLQEVSKTIPSDGIILVDRELSRLMLAPSLWLVLDRNNVTVPPIETAIGTRVIRRIVSTITDKPVYFVTRATAGLQRPSYTNFVRVGDTVLRLRYVQATYRNLPQHMINEVVPIRVYRIGISFDPKPGFVR
jgi:hypothetical protein